MGAPMSPNVVPTLTRAERAELHEATELTTLEVCALAGATYRQVDHWTVHGALRPLRVDKRPRRTRVWSRQDAAAVWAAVQLLGTEQGERKLETVRALQAEFRAGGRTGRGRYLTVTAIGLGLHETAENAVAALHGQAGRIVPIPPEWLS